MRFSKRLWIELVVELATFSVLVASIAMLWRNNFLLLAIVLAECLFALALWHERQDVSFFLVLTVFGTLAEVAFTHSGVWHYANPTLLGVPLWFPLAFGTAGLTGQRLACTTVRMWETRRKTVSHPNA